MNTRELELEQKMHETKIHLSLDHLKKNILNVLKIWFKVNSKNYSLLQAALKDHFDPQANSFLALPTAIKDPITNPSTYFSMPDSEYLSTNLKIKIQEAVNEAISEYQKIASNLNSPTVSDLSVHNDSHTIPQASTTTTQNSSPSSTNILSTFSSSSDFQLSLNELSDEIFDSLYQKVTHEKERRQNINHSSSGNVSLNKTKT